MKFIILDRDGVINYDSLEYIKSPEEWHPIPGSLEAISLLNKAGFHIVIATNQSGIARGYYTLDTLHKIHQKMIEALASFGGYIDEIFYCPHHPNESCGCRKPQPEMFYQIKDKFEINLQETFFIGDSLSDMQTCETTGCKPILVLSGNGHSVKEYAASHHIPIFENLLTAAEYIIKEN